MGKNKPEESKELVAQQPGIVMPAVSPEEAIAAWKAYQALKVKITEQEDIQLIQGKQFHKKSYWRKVATFFNLSVEVVEEREDKSDPTNIAWDFTFKATAPNGRYAYGTGSCDQLEGGRKNTRHNTRTKAETRAFNRAVSNLVGGGEVSAEEMEGVHVQEGPTPREMREKLDQQHTNGNGNYKPTQKQLDLLAKLFDEKELITPTDKPFTKSQMLDQYHATSIEQLTGDQASRIISNLLKLKNKAIQKQVGPYDSPNDEILDVDPDEAEEGIEAMKKEKK